MPQTVHRIEREGIVGRLGEEFWGIVETLESEHLKTAAEIALSGLSRTDAGIGLLEFISGKNRVDDPRLRTEVAGIELDNPVMVGAGWDKKGRAVAGLHALGFSAVEVGSVPLFPQPGNERPRMWTKGGSVALNRIGFNSDGAAAVQKNLLRHHGSGIPIGVNVGLNKLAPHSIAPVLHAEVTQMLEPYAKYIVLNPSSPNTPGLRSLQEKSALRDNLIAVVEKANGKPVLVKISPDEFDTTLTDIVDVGQELGIAGFVCANTTVDERIKALYGWEGQAGGVSGNDLQYKKAVHAVMIRLVYEVRQRVGTKMEIIRVGGISSGTDAVEALIGGASAVQVVTGIRENKWRTATMINKGILEWMDHHGVKSIAEIIESGRTNS